ncbi:MAG: DUF2784 domain-containing protein [Acidimicrobiia bacterium]|nr:DUF2784 domain-containing protein [Acidimicrobiia bacterium]
MAALTMAILMALAHGLLTVFLVFGVPFVARRPRLLRCYLAMLVPTALVNIIGLACPLTVWEKHFWRLAGETPYEGGFISHYFLEPFYSGDLAPSTDTVLLVAMVIWSSPWLIYAASLSITQRRSRHQSNDGPHEPHEPHEPHQARIENPPHQKVS